MLLQTPPPPHICQLCWLIQNLTSMVISFETWPHPRRTAPMLHCSASGTRGCSYKNTSTTVSRQKFGLVYFADLHDPSPRYCGTTR